VLWPRSPPVNIANSSADVSGSSPVSRHQRSFSSATVRGTIWLVQDQCNGTLTKVKRGTVAVRDLKRKKTVSVKAGHSYLARAQRAASKTKRH
jgi:hypothetical protein